MNTPNVVRRGLCPGGLWWLSALSNDSFDPVASGAGITASGAVMVEVQGVKPELLEAGQVTLTKRDVPRHPGQTAPIGERFDSIAPGPYEVRVQVVGYIPATVSRGAWR